MLFRMKERRKSIMQSEQLNLLQSSVSKPLAERMRPQSLDEFIGQDDVIGESSMIKKEIMNDQIPSMILWGPPGCGKTTLINIISMMTNTELYKLSAISAGVKEIKEILKIGANNQDLGVRTILFIDEIHRLNKSQQDVLLEDVEKGNIILIGATTENPSFEINRALLSRMRVVVFKPLTQEMICKILTKALNTDEKLVLTNVKFSNDSLMEIAAASGGDARSALNILEATVNHYSGDDFSNKKITPENIRKLFSDNVMVYDKKSDQHYQAISALHKSMRNSDPDAAVYWLARMLEAGEDPLYIARRLIRFASEDIGLACNNAIQIAVAVFQAVHFIGMPECAVNLTQAVIYFSLLPKSNSLYNAYEKAKEVAKNTSDIPVPLHLRNASTELMAELKYGEGYKYAHDYDNGITDMICLPEQLVDSIFYNPISAGDEKSFKEKLESIKNYKKGII